MKKVAISACLLGNNCRYDATGNRNDTLIKMLKNVELIPFCPEDYAFGSPRPTMDLIRKNNETKAISNKTGEDLTLPISLYAVEFFNKHQNIDLYIGKDRSPSCGVCSSKLYDEEKHLLSDNETGFMTQEARKRDIPCIDAEKYRG